MVNVNPEACIMTNPDLLVVGFVYCALPKLVRVTAPKLMHYTLLTDDVNKG